MTDHEGQESMAGTRRPIIEVKNLRKEYPVLDETVVALERINLTIPQGQICCIYGESGSGKSTLLNQLAGMEKPTKGGVRIGGVPISRLNERQLAEFRQKHLGYPHPTCLTIVPTHHPCWKSYPLGTCFVLA